MAAQALSTTVQICTLGDAREPVEQEVRIHQWYKKNDPEHNFFRPLVGPEPARWTATFRQTTPKHLRRSNQCSFALRQLGGNVQAIHRRYQALKKWYGAEGAYLDYGCELVEIMDSESLAFRNFSFQRDVFGRYARQPWLYVLDYQQPAADCIVSNLEPLWGVQGSPAARLWRELKLPTQQGWADDTWLFEGRIVAEMMAQMRRAHSPRSVADLHLTWELGPQNENLVYYNWVRFNQAQGNYTHIKAVNIDTYIKMLHPKLFANLTDNWLLSFDPYRNYCGVTVARVMATALEARHNLNLPQKEWLYVRRNLIEIFNKFDLVYARGNEPRPWQHIRVLLPEWHGFYCHSNCYQWQSGYKEVVAAAAA